MSAQQNLLDILRGYSSFVYNKDEYFFKHPTIFEKIEEIPKEQFYKERGLSLGILSEKELIENSIRAGKWKEEDEEEYKYLSKKISTGKRAKSKLNDERLIKEYENTLAKNKEELDIISAKRFKITSPSLENYVHSKTYFDNCQKRCFVDKDLTKNIPEESSKNILSGYIQKYQELIDLNNLLVASYLPDFFETIRLSTDPMFVFGKIAKDLTVFQRDLLICGKLLKTKIENVSKIPPYAMKDAIELYHYVPKDNETDEVPINIRKNAENKGGIENMTASDKIT